MRRRVITSIVLIVLVAGGCSPVAQPPADSVERAFQQHSSNTQVIGEGVVTRILRDDTAGSPHQRFILKLASGQTVLIDHNIDLAPRIADLKAGDTVSFSGEYVWNEQGGLIHWTHHDPAGRHANGWLVHYAKKYQ